MKIKRSSASRIGGAISITVDKRIKAEMISLEKGASLQGTELQALARVWNRQRRKAEEFTALANQTQMILKHIHLSQKEMQDAVGIITEDKEC